MSRIYSETRLNQEMRPTGQAALRRTSYGPSPVRVPFRLQPPTIAYHCNVTVIDGSLGQNNTQQRGFRVEWFLPSGDRWHRESWTGVWPTSSSGQPSLVILWSTCSQVPETNQAKHLYFTHLKVSINNCNKKTVLQSRDVNASFVWNRFMVVETYFKLLSVLWKNFTN